MTTTGCEPVLKVLVAASSLLWDTIRHSALGKTQSHCFIFLNENTDSAEKYSTVYCVT
jgi:hypothetical protein